ncbi:MAG TPA: hypothetical protein VH251_05905 [Verrucomicrobiae bacterium]|jgi:hypothetical protein|nr:hypothetical protein [Verrucomicrobiae bacterium]
MKHLSLFWLSLASAILLSGCASTQPTVGAWHDSHFTPQRTDKLALTLRPDPTDEDARLGRILTAELEREGFNLVPLAEADYALTYVIENSAETSEVPGALPSMQMPPQTSRDIVTPPNAESFQKPPPATTVVFDDKDIRLYLYTNPKTHPGQLQLVWTGSIHAGETISDGREPLLIEALLGYFGQDYDGPVNLPK